MENPSVQIPPGGQAPAKSNTTKIIIIVIAVLAVLCLGACAVILLVTGSIGKSIAENVDVQPADVASAAAKIADFDLPPGFEPQTSFSLMGMSLVMYQGPSQDSAMVLIQMPTKTEMTDASFDQMKEQIERQMNRQMRSVTTVEDYDTTIRGQDAKVIIQEGEAEGYEFRQMLVAFQGRGGLAMMSIFGPLDSWDQDEYDQMIESIR